MKPGHPHRLFYFMALSFCLGLLPPGTAVAQTAEESFQKALSAQGADYVQARRDFLANADLELLNRKFETGNANEWVQARILLGWINNDARYRELLDARPTTNRALRKHFPWARRQLLEENVAPLLVEMLLKGGPHENAKFDAEQALIKMLRSGVRLDPRFFTQPVKEMDATTRRLLASVISQLPPTQDDRLFEELDGLFRSENDTLTSKYLLAGMVRQSAALSDEKRQSLVDSLNNDESITRFGNQTVYSALADIGGKNAETALLDHFDNAMEAKDPAQQRDAVKMLFQLKASAATEKLLGLARQPDSPLHLRKLIHSGLANAPYDEKIESHLLDVLKNETLTSGERVEALKSLNKIKDGLNSNGKEFSNIQDSFKSMLKGSINDPALKKILQDSYNSGLGRDKY